MSLAKYFTELRTLVGQALPRATIYVYAHGTTTLADLYEDDEITRMDNPLQTDDRGMAAFNLAAGTYDIRAQSGSQARLYTKVQIGLGSGGATVTDWTQEGMQVKVGGSGWAGTPRIYNALWRRVGTSMDIRFFLEQDTAAVGSGTAGQYTLVVPDMQEIDLTKAGTLDLTGNTKYIGYGRWSAFCLSGFGGYFQPRSSTSLGIVLDGGSDWNSTVLGSNYNLGSNNARFCGEIQGLPIVGW